MTKLNFLPETSQEDKTLGEENGSQHFVKSESGTVTHKNRNMVEIF